MTCAEREDFLAGVHIGVLGVERPGGPPLLTPVWYRVSDGVVELNTAREQPQGRPARRRRAGHDDRAA